MNKITAKVDMDKVVVKTEGSSFRALVKALKEKGIVKHIIHSDGVE